MKKYFITNAGLKIEIDRERAIKIKALQLFYKMRDENKALTMKECEELVKKEMK